MRRESDLLTIVAMGVVVVALAIGLANRQVVDERVPEEDGEGEAER